MVLEGVMIIIASVCLTVFHPGRVFGSAWHEADFALCARCLGRRRKIEGAREATTEEKNGSSGMVTV